MPPAPAATPPTAPAPSPSPAPAPAPSPAPAPAPAPAPTRTSTSIYDDIPGSDNDSPSPGIGNEPTVPPKKTPEPPKPGEPSKAPPAEPPAPEELDEDGIPKFKQNKDLRNWAVDRHKTAKNLEAKAKSLETKISDLEKRPTKDGEVENLTRQLAEVNKKLEEYDQEIKLTRYERSPEYKKDYLDKIDSTIAKAHRSLEELQVDTRDEDGEVNGSRKATPADLQYLYRLPTGEAIKQAKAMFGDASPIVLGWREKIKELSESAQEAVETWKQKGTEYEQQQAARSTQEREARAQMWRSVNEDLTKKHAGVFGEDANDPEGNELRNKGYMMADKAFDPAARKAMSLQEQVMLDAQIRHRAANFGRMVARNKKLATELSDAKKTIEELRGSAPGGKPSGGKGEVRHDKALGEKSFDEAFGE